jgi:hypothetical protein
MHSFFIKNIITLNDNFIIEEVKMKKKECLKQLLIVGTVIILIFSSIPSVFGDELEKIKSSNDEKETYDSSSVYNNCLVLISGKCKSVKGPLLWLLGFYFPLLKRSFTIQALDREDEALNVIIFGTNPLQIATLYDYDSIYIRITKAKGIFYWGDKSIISKSDSFFVLCRASSVFVSF